MRQVIYISGPMTGLPDLNKPAFHTAFALLHRAGYVVVNPACNGLPDEAPWTAHLREDIKRLMACDGVATLPGCAASKGARLELHNARALGMRVMTVAQWLAHAKTKTLEAA
ncbi:MAG: DUF4406 domain-containing protein [Burkholderiaceae bacterium]